MADVLQLGGERLCPGFLRSQMYACDVGWRRCDARCGTWSDVQILSNGASRCELQIVKHCTANGLCPSIPSLGPRRCGICVFSLVAAPKRQHGDNFAANAIPHRDGCCLLERFLPDRLPVCLHQSRRLTAAACWRSSPAIICSADTHM